MGEINLVATVAEARALAAHLNSSARARPVAVITAPAGRDAPFIDAAAVHADIEDVADVYLIPTGDVSWEFTRQMPESTQVYGGAGRVYPVGLAWVRQPAIAPLRFAFNAREGQRSTESMISDALGMALAAGLIGRTPPAQSVSRSGEVRGIVAGRALVRLDNGTLANVVAEVTVPGVPIEQVLAKGMTVAGATDRAGRLDVRPMLRSADELPYVEGDVVLARVELVTDRAARLALHPELVVDVPHEAVTTNDLDDLGSLMTVGEVLRVRIASRSPWTLLLSDLEDDELPLPAFALVDGGPPWLVEGLPEAELLPAEPPPDPAPAVVPAPTPTPTTTPTTTTVPTPAIFDRSPRSPAEPPKPAAPPGPTPRPVAPPGNVVLTRVQADLEQVTARLAAAQADIAGMREEQRLLMSERIKANGRARHLEEELARARKRLRATRGTSGTAIDEGPWFSDPEEQLRHEVSVAWVRRVPAGQKADLPLATYQLGPAFLQSLDSTQGVSRAKIVDVLVEVLTGLAARQTSREVHPLRTSDGGDASQWVREDGATCWRVSLQVNTPSARRLHYWQHRDGVLELSRVVVHDDMHP